MDTALSHPEDSCEPGHEVTLAPNDHYWVRPRSTVVLIASDAMIPVFIPMLAIPKTGPGVPPVG